MDVFSSIKHTETSIAVLKMSCSVYFPLYFGKVTSITICLSLVTSLLIARTNGFQKKKTILGLYIVLLLYYDKNIRNYAKNYSKSKHKTL